MLLPGSGLAKIRFREVWVAVASKHSAFTLHRPRHIYYYNIITKAIYFAHLKSLSEQRLFHILRSTKRHLKCLLNVLKAFEVQMLLSVKFITSLHRATVVMVCLSLLQCCRWSPDVAGIESSISTP